MLTIHSKPTQTNLHIHANSDHSDEINSRNTLIIKCRQIFQFKMSKPINAQKSVQFQNLLQNSL